MSKIEAWDSTDDKTKVFSEMRARTQEHIAKRREEDESVRDEQELTLALDSSGWIELLRKTGSEGCWLSYYQAREIAHLLSRGVVS